MEPLADKSAIPSNVHVYYYKLFIWGSEFTHFVIVQISTATQLFALRNNLIVSNWVPSDPAGICIKSACYVIECKPNVKEVAGQRKFNEAM